MRLDGAPKHNYCAGEGLQEFNRMPINESDEWLGESV
jgi:hypothetical protein